MKDKDEVLKEQSSKLAIIERLCEKQMVRVPASVSQASTKAMAMTILKVIKDESV